MAFAGDAQKVEGLGRQEKTKFRVRHNRRSVCVCFNFHTKPTDALNFCQSHINKVEKKSDLLS